MNTINMTADQHEALSRMVRDDRRGPNQTGLHVRTYRALQARGMVKYAGGVGNSSTYELTEDGRMWANENV